MEGSAKIYPVGQSETLDIPWRLSRSNGFNRLTVQVTPQKVRYLVNDHLLYEDNDPSPTSPWLGLLTYQERYSVWRHLTLKGRPKVPAEVRLSHGDRLEGWVSSFYYETQPARRTDPVARTVTAHRQVLVRGVQRGSTVENDAGPRGPAARSNSTTMTGRPRMA